MVSAKLPPRAFPKCCVPATGPSGAAAVAKHFGDAGGGILAPRYPSDTVQRPFQPSDSYDFRILTAEQRQRIIYGSYKCKTHELRDKMSCLF